MSNILLAIDPGDVQSAFVFMDMDTYKPLYFEKEDNSIALGNMVEFIRENNVKDVAIEMIASYGMGVGKTVFDTCVWIGRFSERLELRGCNINYIFRMDEKMNICKSMKAKDANIRIALIDRFAQFDHKSGKGTKKNPDWFYGFSADCWQAYAVGTTYIDIKRGRYKPIE